MKKSTLYSIFIFIGVFLVFIIGYYDINSLSNKEASKDVYSCIDPETNREYTFDNEEEMHNVCDSFNTNETKNETTEKQTTTNNSEVVVEDVGYDLYPYVRDDGKKAVTIIITDCNNIDSTKNEALNKFGEEHNINDYVIEYEYPCG